MRVDHPAARKSIVTMGDLSGGTAVGHGDVYVPSLPRETLFAPGEAQRSMLTYERASQFELVATLPQAYAWVSPIPQEMLDRYHLTLRPCADRTARHKDVLIYRRRYMSPPWTSFSWRRSPACKASWRVIRFNSGHFLHRIGHCFRSGLCPCGTESLLRPCIRGFIGIIVN